MSSEREYLFTPNNTLGLSPDSLIEASQWSSVRLASPEYRQEETGRMREEHPDIFAFMIGMGKLRITTEMIAENQYPTYLNGFLFMMRTLNNHYFPKSILPFNLSEDAALGHFQDLIDIEVNGEHIDTIKEACPIPSQESLHPSSLNYSLQYESVELRHLVPLVDTFKSKSQTHADSMMEEEKFLGTFLQNGGFVNTLSPDGTFNGLKFGASDAYGIAQKMEDAKYLNNVLKNRVRKINR
jgi:hypothetical protein